MSALTIALINHKGGVGKSTTAINLAATLAAGGERVLVVDLDSQGNATIATVDACEQGVAEILGYGTEEAVEALAPRMIVRSERFGVDVLGANFKRLNHQEVALTSSPMLMARLVEMVEALEDHYDYILFDCPPALRALTTATMYATEYVLLIVEPAIESIDGLGNLLAFIAGLKVLTGREPIVAGAVITKANPRERLVRDITDLLVETGRVPWVQTIYNTAGFKDAYEVRRPLSAVAKSPAHQRAVADFAELALKLVALKATAVV
jgi:chromosome partitioning protein